MKDRATWVFLVFAVLVLGGIFLLRNKPAPPPAPAAPVVRAGRNGEPVAIQDGKTIDMSSGRAVVQDDARSRAAIEKSVKEMEDAAKEVTFGPRPAEKKKAAEPAPKP